MSHKQAKRLRKLHPHLSTQSKRDRQRMEREFLARAVQEQQDRLKALTERSADQSTGTVQFKPSMLQLAAITGMVAGLSSRHRR